MIIHFSGGWHLRDTAGIRCWQEVGGEAGESSWTQGWGSLSSQGSHIPEPMANSWRVLKTWDMNRLAFLKDPSGSPGEDESRRSETGGRDLSTEGVAKCRQKTWSKVTKEEDTDLDCIREAGWTRPGHLVMDTKETGTQVNFQIFYLTSQLTYDTHYTLNTAGFTESILQEQASST